MAKRRDECAATKEPGNSRLGTGFDFSLFGPGAGEVPIFITFFGVSSAGLRQFPLGPFVALSWSFLTPISLVPRGGFKSSMSWI
jgi:hypothetical protein